MATSCLKRAYLILQVNWVIPVSLVVARFPRLPAYEAVALAGADWPMLSLACPTGPVSRLVRDS